VRCAALGNPISTPRPVNDIAIEAYKLGQPSFSLLIAPCVRIQRLWCQHIKPRAFPRRLASWRLTVVRSALAGSSYFRLAVPIVQCRNLISRSFPSNRRCPRLSICQTAPKTYNCRLRHQTGRSALARGLQTRRENGKRPTTATGGGRALPRRALGQPGRTFLAGPLLVAKPTGHQGSSHAPVSADLREVGYHRAG
jgi:hypothetical protein